MDKLKKSFEFLKKDIELFTIQDVKQLQKIIEYHSDLYYNKQEPIISDKEYDELFKKLELLEEKYKDSLDYFQTREVWAKIVESSFKKVKHTRPMISLDNTYNEEDLLDFDERVKKNLWLKDDNIDIEYSLELKFDWLWIELIYENWEYKQAITRWNWIEGEDVTENVRQIENIPKKINYKDRLEVRWEIIMPISVFEELNKQARKTGDKDFSNPRNAASWSVRTKDISLTKKRKLEFFAYDLGNFEEFCNKENKQKYNEVIEDLAKLWFETSPYFKVNRNIEEVIKNIDNFWDRKRFDFEIDGLVIKVNDISLWEKIGWTQHHPRYAIAYKFPALILTTKILSVDHQVGRTGTITPVANLEPINISWAIIKRATLHNYEEVEELDVRIWDIVFIKRAWEVIPKIISVVKVEDRSNLEKILPPKVCPSCGIKVEKQEWKVRYFCPNYKWCEAQIIERLAYAVWKEWFDIDGFWEKQVKKFYELWFISDLASIFELKKYKKEILALEWFQQKSVDNLLNAIEKATKVNIINFLVALSIFWVGKKVAKILSVLFKDKTDLVNFNYSLEDLEKLEEIWPEIAEHVIKFFKDKDNKKMLEKLLSLIEIRFLQEKNIDKSSEFYGKKFCITGSFEISWKKITREEIIEKLEWLWAKYISSVSKNLDFLLVWEKAGSKLEKAKSLWVQIFHIEKIKKLF